MLQVSGQILEAAAPCRDVARPAGRGGSGPRIPSPPCASASWCWSSRSRSSRCWRPGVPRCTAGSGFGLAVALAGLGAGLVAIKALAHRPRASRSPRSAPPGPHRGSRTTFASVSRTPARRQSKPGGHSVYEFANASRRSTATSRVSSRRSAPRKSAPARSVSTRTPAATGSNPSGHQVSRSARAPDRFAPVRSARPRSAPRRSTPCNPARHSRQSRSRVRRRSARASFLRR